MRRRAKTDNKALLTVGVDGRTATPWSGSMLLQGPSSPRDAWILMYTAIRLERMPIEQAFAEAVKAIEEIDSADAAAAEEADPDV
jgi:hypothetical protein